MQKKNEAVERYLNRITQEIYNLAPVDQFINTLRQDLYEYEENHPDCSEDDLEAEFGLPEEIAKEFLESQDWVEKMNNLINYFKEKEDLFFIWRPHPLLSSTMKSMRPFIKKEFDHIIETLGSMENVEIDERSTADISIKASDALISDYSSIICQYTVTGKPVLVTTGTRNDRYFKILSDQ